jgi:hypothetical protein
MGGREAVAASTSKHEQRTHPLGEQITTRMSWLVALAASCDGDRLAARGRLMWDWGQRRGGDGGQPSDQETRRPRSGRGGCFALPAVTCTGPTEHRRSNNKRGRVTSARFLCPRHHFRFVRHVDRIIVDGISKSASLACIMCLVPGFLRGFFFPTVMLR